MDLPSFNEICSKCKKKPAENMIIHGMDPVYICKQCSNHKVTTVLYCYNCKSKIEGDFKRIIQYKISQGKVRHYEIMYCKEQCIKENVDLKSLKQQPNTDYLGKLCKMCDKLHSKKCSKCKDAYYCSKECQIKDWPEHKKYCKPSN